MHLNIDRRTGNKTPPLGVLEAFAQITDDELGHDVAIAIWQTELNRSKTKWEAARVEFDKIRYVIDGIPPEIDRLKAAIEVIQAKRPDVLAAIILGNASFDCDDKLLAEKAALELRIDRLMRCQTGMAARLREAESMVAEAVRPVIDFEDRIAERLRDLKLELAEQRCAA